MDGRGGEKNLRRVMDWRHTVPITTPLLDKRWNTHTQTVRKLHLNS